MNVSRDYLHTCSFLLGTPLLHSLPDPVEGTKEREEGADTMTETTQDSAYLVHTVAWHPQPLLPCPCQHGATLRDNENWTLLWTEHRYPRKWVGENWRGLSVHSSIQFYVKRRKDDRFLAMIHSRSLGNEGMRSCKEPLLSQCAVSGFPIPTSTQPNIQMSDDKINKVHMIHEKK